MNFCSLLYGFLSILILFTEPSRLSAQSFDPLGLSEVETTYLDNKDDDKIGFKSVPVDHMLPKRQTVVFAIDATLEDRKIISQERALEKNTGSLSSYEAKGYDVSPFAGLSLKNVAFGVTVSKSEKEYISSSGYGYEQEQFSGSRETSKVAHSGLGFNVYLNPFPSFKRIFWTFHVGSKLLNVTHATRLDQLESGSISYSFPDSEPSSFETIKYTITEQVIGSTFNIKIGKRIRLIPWLNYSIVDTNDIDFQVGTEESPKVSFRQRFLKDKKIIWSSDSPLDYGIDLSFTISRLEIHFGDLLGALYRSAFANDLRIEKDAGFNVGFSYDFKAK